MPKRTDIESVLILGAGPIVIGQACEFDYSGAQACKALREEGFRVVLVNSNPATIMTDPAMADATYVEPITPEVVAKVIAKERPDALLPTLGGQTGLNTFSIGFESVGDEAGDEFMYSDVIAQRFANPAIRDTVRRVAFDGASRHTGFVLPMVRERLAAGASVDGLALVEALWARMCAGL